MDASKAAVFVMCPYFQWNRQVGTCNGTEPEERLKEYVDVIKSGAGYLAQRPHVWLGNAELGPWAYRKVVTVQFLTSTTYFSDLEFFLGN